MKNINMLIKVSIENYWSFYLSKADYLTEYTIHIYNAIRESHIANRQNKTIPDRSGHLDFSPKPSLVRI